MEEEKITLDKESFKALASDTRVAILKSLGKRRKMLTELSKQLEMSPSTVKEHMDNLSKAGLVVQIDDGHKWKYYELTSKGKNILHPEETKIWILLSISILAMIGILYDLFQRSYGGLMTFAREAAPAAGQVGDAIKEAPAAGAETELVAQTAALALPIYHIIGIAVFAVILGSCIAFLALNRRKLLKKI